MNARTRTVAVAGVACLAVALPAAAQAKTKTVDMGLPVKSQKTFQKHGSDVNDFFPHGVTIHVGDKVKFVPTGFHSVQIPPKAGRVAPFAAPTGQTVSGAKDAAGTDFWFNGQPQLAFNPVLLPPGGFGKHFRYTGKKDIQSGLPLAPKNKPMTVKFTKAGRYTYFCNLHPGMKGTVRVRPKGKAIPSAKADKRTLKRQLKRDLKIAKGLALTSVPAKTVDVGSAGPHGVEFYAMFPLKGLTVHVGDSVNFRITKGSYEAHTATFGPGNINDPSSYIGGLAASFQSPAFDPRAVYPSERPGTEAAYTSLLHGNGFWNAGAMDRSNATPLASSNSVKFEQPGTYQFYCLIHPFMVGTVHVVAP